MGFKLDETAVQRQRQRARASVSVVGGAAHVQRTESVQFRFRDESDDWRAWQAADTDWSRLGLFKAPP
jgi:hypothetical protein